jgi:TolB protein
MRYLPFFVLLLLSGCKEAATSEDNVPQCRIAYNVYMPDNTENYDIFVMDMDGSNRTNLTASKAIEWTYYAYKDRLFYISDEDTSYKCYFLYETDAFGKNKRKISDLRLEDSWMSSRKNGDEVVVCGRTGADIRFQLFIINTVSGSFRQVTNDTMSRYADPAFSPDGKQLVFACKKNKRDTATHEELFLMDADGGEMTQLTHYPQNDPARRSHEFKAGSPQWHPSGEFISYVSHQAGQTNIFAVKPDGSKQWRLTEGKNTEGWYDWSDDGKWLAYDHADEASKGRYHIMLMNWETKEIKQLTDTTYKYQLSPVFIQTR